MPPLNRGHGRPALQILRSIPLGVAFVALFKHCRWMNTSTARQEGATLSLYTTSRTITDTAPMFSFAGCQNSTALISLRCSITPRVEVNFVDVCGFDARRGSSELKQVRLPVRSAGPRTHTSVLLYSDTVLCPGDNSIRLGRTDASRQNSATKNARSMSYRYTGVMLCQALCRVQRQL